ncbi:ATP-binding protein [Adonisia turfae]|uniref:ATP-binding protein n=1 Tax=Adonisia turfae CCMR0081 TaxID=2292702 RepID=A0A6M0RG00_9CYAN|nr:ATP-binding protein [Adonisia turfae]NEZ55197.1 ATP-binding protein [Adonisia turfae CCMR0081]
MDFLRFFDACDPSRTLIISKPEDRQYYVDFAEVRGGKIIEAIERTIALKSFGGESSCQLFTGHIGCGKSTELRRLQADLEEQGFYVVYFESSQDLDLADVDVTDILLAIAHRISIRLENIGIKLKPSYFEKLFKEVSELLQTPIEFSEFEFSLPIGLGKLTALTKESPKTRGRLRQYLEPLTSSILDALNQDVLGKANQELKLQGKKGLVVLVDSLDRVDNRVNDAGRPQPEYLFIDRGEQLRKLNCHVVYTIPLSLTFSNDHQTMINRFGGGVLPKTLPMVPVRLRNGDKCVEGMNLLRQLIMARAFPDAKPQEYQSLISEVFDDTTTLDRLCNISGGHVRNLLGMLYTCLQEQDPPLKRTTLERVIREYEDRLKMAITEDEWQLLNSVEENKMVSGEKGYQILLRSLFVFEYHDKDGGRWFDLNPLIKSNNQNT